MEYRQLGETGIEVSAVALGCWPIAGVSSLDVNDDDSLATIRACFDVGINFLDTAYCYGKRGESERLIARALGSRRDEFVIATKVGIHWGPDGGQVTDARPATIRRECEESLTRLGTDRVELLYLHAPDEKTPIAESAGALLELMNEGKTRSVGVSNVSLDQLRAFANVCPLTAYQPPYNMLQRQIEAEMVPWCQENRVSVCVYWPLLKGLLAGKLPRGHVFPPQDGRAKYPMFQGQEWQKNQDFVDRLRVIASDAGKTVAQLVINWTIHQAGIDVALCGAKRATQIRETAAGAGWRLSDIQNEQIAEAIAARGPSATRGAV